MQPYYRIYSGRVNSDDSPFFDTEQSGRVLPLREVPGEGQRGLLGCRHDHLCQVRADGEGRGPERSRGGDAPCRGDQRREGKEVKPRYDLLTERVQECVERLAVLQAEWETNLQYLTKTRRLLEELLHGISSIGTTTSARSSNVQHVERGSSSGPRSAESSPRSTGDEH